PRRLIKRQSLRATGAVCDYCFSGSRYPALRAGSANASLHARNCRMCRSIKTLFNFAPPPTNDGVRAASLQFVRKLSGFTAPSKANEPTFNRAVEDVFVVARRLVDSLTTTAARRNTQADAAEATPRAL